MCIQYNSGMKQVLHNAAILVKMFLTFSDTSLDVTIDPIKNTPIYNLTLI